MSKKKKKKKPKLRNIVAKFMNEFCKSSVVKDKTKYTRKEKHKGNHE